MSATIVSIRFKRDAFTYKNEQDFYVYAKKSFNPL